MTGRRLALALLLAGLWGAAGCLDLPKLRPPADTLDGRDEGDEAGSDLPGIPDARTDLPEDARDVPDRDDGTPADPGARDVGPDGNVQDPGGVDPGTGDPGSGDPGGTDPGADDVAPDPGTGDPGAVDPGVPDPGLPDPGLQDPGTTDPGATDPGATDPGRDASDPGAPDAGLDAGLDAGDPGAPPCGTDDDCDDGGLPPCVVRTCDRSAGLCREAPAEAGTGCVPLQGLAECHVGLCDPDGACLPEAGLEGLACGLPDACAPLRCQGGACLPAAQPNCDDDNPCTDDGCDPATGCTHAPASGATCGPAACDGMNWHDAPTCTGTTCGTPPGVPCADGLDCTLDSCSDWGGCGHTLLPGACLIDGACVPEGTARGGCLACRPDADPHGWSYDAGRTCNDEDPCTHDDRCAPGGVNDDDCAGTPYDCNDGKDCTADACTGSGLCRHDVIPGRCLVDGTCYQAGESHGNCFTCDPGTAVDAFTYAPAKPCSDGSDCTRNDTCAPGGSTDADCHGTAYSCDDHLPCTADSCNGTGGCTHALVTGWCNIFGTCYAEGASPDAYPCLVCDPGRATDDFSPAPNGKPCAAGTCYGAGALTFQSGKSCQSGTCSSGGIIVNCDDGLACTADACDPATGCQHAVADGCLIEGACRGEGQPDPYEPCLTCDASVSANAWTPSPDGTLCVAASCTGNTWNPARTCGSGECQPLGLQVPCSDGNDCTTDSCATQGCVFTNEPAGTPCGKGGTCDPDGHCLPTCGTTPCPYLDGYDPSCNDAAMCEYAHRYAWGWQLYDTWIWIPPATFTMGSPDTEPHHSPIESPQHDVTFDYGFFIAKYEVTTETYEACRLNFANCTLPFVTPGYDGEGWGLNTSDSGRATHPANGLIWAQALAVCQWLGGTLPTEAQWEYAAAGPKDKMYPWGSVDPDCTRANFDADGSPGSPYACTPGCEKEGCSGTLPVGGAAAGVSWCGALDMAGNAWEWCADSWHSDYTGAPTDGSAWVDPKATYGVVRGGSFEQLLAGGTLRTAARAPSDFLLGRAAQGARCARGLK
jgi:formylglycine-generating enzyme required for sulfatase activity